MLENNYHNPALLGLLLCLPLLAAWMWRIRRATPSLRFSAALPALAARHGLRALLEPWLGTLTLAALGFGIVALARPQERDARTRESSVDGIDIMIALDLSSSMDAADFRPNNRLYVAKEVLTEFISQRSNDRIGLVVFSGAAYTQAPLTLDYNVLNEIVRQLKTRALEDGTAIGDAIASALNRLRDSDAKSKVVVLITDGDNNAGKLSPVDAAAMAKALGIPVYPILVGKGGLVPFPLQNAFGQTVWKEVDLPVNPQLLENIAATTGGEYYRAIDKDGLRTGLRKVLDSLERSKLLDGGAQATYRELYPRYATWAVALLLLEILLGLTAFRVFP